LILKRVRLGETSRITNCKTENRATSANAPRAVHASPGSLYIYVGLIVLSPMTDRGVAGEDTWHPDDAPHVSTDSKTHPTWLQEYERWLFGWLKRVMEQRDPRSLSLPKETNPLLTVAEIVKLGPLSHDWLTDNLRARNGLGILSSTDGGGKSSLTPFDIRALLRNEPFAGRSTLVRNPRVLVLSLEETRAQTIERFREADVNGTEFDNIWLTCEDDPYDELRMFNPFVWLARRIADKNINVTKIDTALDFVAFEDLNDYTVVQEALVPLRKLARDSNSYIEVYFHPNKEGEPFGSVRIRAVVDVYMILEGNNTEYRTLSAIKTHKGKAPRSGMPLEPITITKDGRWGALTPVEPSKIVDLPLAKRILDFVSGNPSVAKNQICTFIGGRKQECLRMIDQLVRIDAMRMDKKGTGERAPEHYWIPVPGLRSTVEANADALRILRGAE
jgi:AAA domain-containing protein